MCCRYLLNKPDAVVSVLSRALEIRFGPADRVEPRHNVAPSQTAPVVAMENGGAELRQMTWGLVPPADRGSPRPRLLVNARAETLTKLPAFREAAASRRCLVPANGFYEFKDLGRQKEPYLFLLRDEEPFALAGLWEPPGEDGPGTFCVVTTEPNATMTPIHNRMPVILTSATMGQWLGAQPLADAELAELTRPLAAELLTARRLGSYVNNSRHEGPQCLASPESELF